MTEEQAFPFAQEYAQKYEQDATLRPLDYEVFWTGASLRGELLAVVGFAGTQVPYLHGIYCRDSISGRKCLAALIKVVTDALPTMCGYIHKTNTKMLQLYAKLGIEIIGETEDEYLVLKRES